MLAENTQAERGEGFLVAVFSLAEGAFGIDTTLIQEVVMQGEITPVRHAPPYVAGIRNLRGRIVTVIDLRVRLELAERSPTTNTRILIAEWKGEPIGLMIDRVEETTEINLAGLQPPPANLNGVQRKYLRGVFRGGERLVALLDAEAVLNPEFEASNIERAGQANDFTMPRC